MHEGMKSSICTMAGFQILKFLIHWAVSHLCAVSLGEHDMLGGATALAERNDRTPV
jgi:hypothetical protein